MKAWIQRVTEASVTIDGEVVVSIGKGYLVLLGVTHADTAKPLYERVVANLRARLGDARVRSGRFGADMKVRLLNDGPCSFELVEPVA